MTTLTTALKYQAKLPFSYKMMDKVEPTEIKYWGHQNVSLLRALAAMETTASPEKDFIHDGPTNKSLERIEARLDIAMMMLSHLMKNQAEPTNSRNITLSTSEVSWELIPTEISPEVGSLLVMDIYLSELIAIPLKLFGQIASHQQGETRAALIYVDSQLEEWLTRTIFRYDRLAIQASKEHP